MLNIFRVTLFVVFAFVSNISIAGQEDLHKISFADLVEKLSPAVVNISTSQKIPSRKLGKFPFPEGSPFEEFNDFFERFGLPPGIELDEGSKVINMLGSGFIIDAEGYVATNNHVIADADEIWVTLNDNTKMQAKLIGTDPKTDLALLKVESPKPLPFVPFGDSDESRVGDWILAIGNPFGLGGTVTSGVISAKARDINAGPYDDFIQIDAAINKGNSGGPLFNMKGEVIAINTAIYSQTGGNIGIGFSTPTSLAQPVLDQLKQGKKVIRSWLGVKIQPITEDVKEGLGLTSDNGALVVEVSKDSPAEKGSIKVGDIILQYHGKDITNTRKLPKFVAETAPGTKVEVVVLRKGKKRKLIIYPEKYDDITGTVLDKKEHDDKEKPKKSNDILGMELAPVSPELRQKFSLDSDSDGLFIVEIARKSDAYSKGIRKGDIIAGANQEMVKTTSELLAIIKKAKEQGRKNILLLVNRGDRSIFVAVSIK